MPCFDVQNMNDVDENLEKALSSNEVELSVSIVCVARCCEAVLKLLCVGAKWPIGGL